MIKGNETNDGNIDMELQALKGDKLFFYILFTFKIFVRISVTSCPVELGFESKCSILNEQVIYTEKRKLKIIDM